MTINHWSRFVAFDDANVDILTARRLMAMDGNGVPAGLEYLLRGIIESNKVVIGRPFIDGLHELSVDENLDVLVVVDFEEDVGKRTIRNIE